jgi:hypothetical protein
VPFPVASQATELHAMPPSGDKHRAAPDASTREAAHAKLSLLAELLKRESLNEARVVERLLT